MELYEILFIGLGLVLIIGLDRVYRIMSDIKENGIMSMVEYTISDESIQKIVDIVLESLKKETNVNSTTEEELQSSDSHST